MTTNHQPRAVTTWEAQRAQQQHDELGQLPNVQAERLEVSLADAAAAVRRFNRSALAPQLRPDRRNALAAAAAKLAPLLSTLAKRLEVKP